MKKPPPGPFSDLYRYVPRGGETRGLERAARFIAVALLSHSWHACFLLRLSQWLWWLRLWPLAWLLRTLLLHCYSLDAPPEVPIGPGLWLPHAQNIVIHRRSKVGSGVTILHNVTIGGRDYAGYPTIGNRVFLGVGSSVLGAIHISDGARIGAHAVVIADVPAGACVVGVPAHSAAGRGSEQGAASL